MNQDEIRKFDREHYGDVATGKKIHQPARETEDIENLPPQDTSSC